MTRAEGKFDATFVITCRSVTASRSVGASQVGGRRSRGDGRNRGDAVLRARLSCAGRHSARVRLGAATILSFAPIRWSSPAGAVIGPSSGRLHRPLSGLSIADADARRGQRRGERSAGDRCCGSWAPARSRPPAAAGADFDPQAAFSDDRAEPQRSSYRSLAHRERRPEPGCRRAHRRQRVRSWPRGGACGFQHPFQPDAAAEHFTRADAIMASAPDATSGFLTSKRDTYRALDLVNQGQFQAALELLNRLAGPAVGAPGAARRPGGHKCTQPARGREGRGGTLGPSSKCTRARQAAPAGTGELGEERRFARLGRRGGRGHRVSGRRSMSWSRSAPRTSAPRWLSGSRRGTQRQLGRLAARSGNSTEALAA